MKILIAEDEVVSRRALEAKLIAWGFDVTVARDGDEAWELLRRPDAPRLALLDWLMPGPGGPEVCRRVRAQAQEPYIYVVLLSGRDRREQIIEGLRSGADDYLTKPFDPQELELRLRIGQRIVSLQAELHRSHEALAFRATHDSLTGVLTRGAVLEELAREGERLRRGGAMAVLMLDLDHFKKINDAHGHVGGDAVLREAARRLSVSLRPYDVIGRYGGEEFLVLLPGCDDSGALCVADRLRRSLGASPVAFGDRAIAVTCSIGAAASSDLAGVETMLVRADEALFAAKRQGRDRVVVDSTGAGCSKSA